MIRNLMWSSISFLLRLLSNVIIFFLIAKEYGPEKFGYFSTLVLYATTITLLSDLGTHQRLYKEISIEGNDVKFIHSLKLVFVTVSLLISTLCSAFSGSLEILLVIISYIANGYIDFIQVRLRAKAEFRKEAFSALINNIVFFSITATTLYFSESILVLSISFLLARIISIILMIYFLRIDSYKYWVEIFSSLNLNLKSRIGKKNESQIYYSIDFLLTNLWTIIDSLVVKNFFSIFIFGLYSSYSRIINGISSISVIFTNVVFKNIARDATAKKNRNLTIGTLILFTGGGGCFLLLYLSHRVLVQKILGNEYSEYAIYLPYMFIPIWLKWISSCLGIYLLGAGGVKKRVFAQATSLVVFMIIFMLGYKLGYTVEAVITSLSISYIVILLFYFKYFMDHKNEN
ncbi:lipopolysaccharide biosynthesis protein [Citrobacter braakii]|nr:oligosaccharide flippase family protein [Citrobacter braakii]